jgi:hypothetical protein
VGIFVSVLLALIVFSLLTRYWVLAIVLAVNWIIYAGKSILLGLIAFISGTTYAAYMAKTWFPNGEGAYGGWTFTGYYAVGLIWAATAAQILFLLFVVIRGCVRLARHGIKSKLFDSLTLKQSR